MSGARVDPAPARPHTWALIRLALSLAMALAGLRILDMTQYEAVLTPPSSPSPCRPAALPSVSAQGITPPQPAHG